MNKLISIILLLFSIATYPQDFDVRKTNWGMTISEVINSEKPLNPATEKSDEVRYDNVDLDGKTTASVLYEFSNARLIKVRYLIYGPTDSYSKGTCKNFIPLRQKLYATRFVFDAILQKRMTSYSGWRISGTSEITAESLKLGGYDNKDFELLDSEVKRVNGTEVQITFFNKRSSAWITIIASKEAVSTVFHCDHSYYNTYAWLVFSPMSDVESEIRRRTF